MLNPHLEVILAATIWGSTGVFVKYLAFPPAMITLFRLLVPTIILYLFFRFERRKLSKEDRPMLLASSLNALRLFLFFVGFTYTSISNAIIMLYTWPIFASIFSMIYLKEKIRPRNVFFLFFSFIGIVLVYVGNGLSFGSSDFIGITAMLMSGCIYSLTVIIFKKESGKYTPLEMIFYQNLLGAFVFLPFLFLDFSYMTLSKVGIAVIYAAMAGVVGFGLFFSALKKIKASTASILSYVEVLSAILFGVLFFSEVLTQGMIIGGSMILLSAYMIKNDG